MNDQGNCLARTHDEQRIGQCSSAFNNDASRRLARSNCSPNTRPCDDSPGVVDRQAALPSVIDANSLAVAIGGLMAGKQECEGTASELLITYK
jgi:hypothetical protein